MQLTGKTYDAMKFITQIGLPAAGTLYFALAGIWGLPSAEQVVGSIVAVDTFLGVVLQISSTNFSKGTAQGVLAVHQSEDGHKFTLEFDGDPRDEIANADRVLFEVKKPPAS